MKTGLGCLMIVAGVVLGLYIGVWWGFIGGIVQVIEQVQADKVDALKVAFGVARIVFSGFLGYLSAAVLLIPGGALVKG